jgi:hypothetical protein
MSVTDIEFEKHLGEGGHAAVTFEIKYPEGLPIETLVGGLERLSGVLHVHVRQRD